MAWRGRRRERRARDDSQSPAGHREPYDAFDERQSPNLQPIPQSEPPQTPDELLASMQGIGSVGAGDIGGGGASQPLDLSQLVMMLSMRMGMSRMSDELIYTLFFAILGTSVNESKLYEETNNLPERMTYGEAREHLRRELSGSGFPMVQLLIAETSGKIDEYVDRDYFRKLVNKNIPIMRNLKMQGILNWGQMAMDSGMGLIPMTDENYQLLNTANPEYRKYVRQLNEANFE